MAGYRQSSRVAAQRSFAYLAFAAIADIEKPRQFERSQQPDGETLGCKMDLGLARTQLLPAAVEIAASLSHQLTRWSTS